MLVSPLTKCSRKIREKFCFKPSKCQADSANIPACIVPQTNNEQTVRKRSAVSNFSLHGDPEKAQFPTNDLLLAALFLRYI